MTYPKVSQFLIMLVPRLTKTGSIQSVNVGLKYQLVAIQNAGATKCITLEGLELQLEMMDLGSMKTTKCTVLLGIQWKLSTLVKLTHLDSCSRRIRSMMEM